MQYTITAPNRIFASVQLPSSKSISNRALIMHALSQSDTLPDNLSDCDDTNVIIKALKEMPYTIDIMAAGTAMRFMTAYLSVTPGEHIITGTERMLHRPIGVLVDALRYMGADIQYVGQTGFPPLKIVGKTIEGGQIDIPGNISSQYISALLMIGPILKNGLQLHLVGDIISRPYIDLTLWMMNEFGAKAEWSDIDTITVASQPYKATSYMIENDWSAASYWYEMIALSSNDDDEVTLSGLMDGSKQGDSSLRYIFSLLGVKTTFVDGKQGEMTSVCLKRNGHRVSKLEYDFLNSPDLAQTFVTCCALMDVKFHFTGLQTLKIKETDRIEALKREMLKLGYVIKDIDGKELLWDGERCQPERDITIDTYDDHRMAMAFAPLSLRLPKIKINNPAVVSKSYPHFWQSIKTVGFDIIDNEI